MVKLELKEEYAYYRKRRKLFYPEQSELSFEEFQRWVKCWEKDYDKAYKEFNSQKINELESMLCL